MDDVYRPPEENRQLQQAVRPLATDKIAPRAAEIDEKREFPWDVYEALKDDRGKSRDTTEVPTRGDEVGSDDFANAHWQHVIHHVANSRGVKSFEARRRANGKQQKAPP